MRLMYLHWDRVPFDPFGSALSPSAMPMGLSSTCGAEGASLVVSEAGSVRSRILRYSASASFRSERVESSAGIKTAVRSACASSIRSENFARIGEAPSGDAGATS